LTQDYRATPQRAGWPRAAGAVVLIALGLAFVAAGIRLWRSTAPDIGAIPPATAAPSAPAGPAAAAPAPSHTAAPFTPTRLRVPRLGIDAPVVPITVQPNGLLAVPADVDTIGWWSAGAAAAAPSGTVVIAGHVDSARQGPGAFFGLRTLRPGDRVILSSADDRTAAYTVAARRQYPKSALPSGEVFGQHTTPRLVLITCGGSFNPETRHYSDNIVVYAVPAPS
jgi:sortase family protein